VSSTASNVSATPAVAPSPWPQTPAATQDNSGGPFAAMLDAAASAPDTANTQPAPQVAAPRTSMAVDQPAAKISAHRNNGTTGTAQNATPDTTASADTNKSATAAATPTVSSNATPNPSATQNATANPAGTAAPTDTTSGGTILNVFAEEAATIASDAGANAVAPDAPTKPSSDKQDDSGSESGAGAAVAATDAQAQPVAAAIVANTVINTPPATATADAVIGGVTSGQDASDASATSDANDVPTAQDVRISVAGQDAKIAVAAQDAKVTTPTAKVATPAQGAKSAVSGKLTSSTRSGAPVANTDNADAASPADGQAWNGGTAPQLQTRADSDTMIPAQSGSSAATRIDALAAPASDAGGSSAAQSGWNAAKAATEGLPNFGIVANQAATAAATPGTAAAATVPVAGLAVAIASRAQAGSSQFDIRLDPPELGRIDVRLGVDRDGQVTSHVTVDRADTLQLLQNQQPQLERALEQAGLKTADNGLQFTLRDQSFAGQNGGSGGGAQPSAAQLVIPDADQPIIQATQIYSRAGLGSGVDIRV